MLKRKITALLCVTALCVPQFMLAGCSRSGKNEKEIYADDTPWFTYSVCDSLASYSNTPDAAYVTNDYLGRTGDLYVFFEQVDYEIPEDELFTDNELQYKNCSLVFLNQDGVEEKRVDLLQLLDEQGLVGNSSFFSVFTDLSYADDERIVLSCSSASGDVWAVLDPDTCEVTKTSTRATSYNGINLAMTFGNGIPMEYEVINEGGRCTLKFNIYDAEGESHKTNLSDILPAVQAYDMYTPMLVDDTHAVAKLKTIDQDDDRWIEIDLTDMSISECTRDMSFLEGVDLNNISYSEDLGNLTLDIEGIKKIDISEGTVEEVFSFDWCNINRSIVNNVELVDMTEDTLFLNVTREVPSGYRVIYRTDLMRLDKCDTNPNIGKTILDVACMGELTEQTAQVICDFNESNDSYYLRYQSYYNVSSYGEVTNISQAIASDGNVDMEVAGYLEADAYDPSISEYLFDAESNMSNALIMDILSGEGPDIILGGASFSQLNNEDYLIDLSEYYSNAGISCFDNIIDVSRTGDKFYQMPLTFTMSGIVAGDTDVTSGFTFDQYADYVDQVCNGLDPMLMNKLDFLTAIVMSQNDIFLQGDTVNFDTEGFRAAVNYADDNVYDIVSADDRYEEHGDDYREITDFYSTLLWGDFYSDCTYLGIPSLEGRGPVANIKSSVAITSQSVDPDGCFEFVKFLLDPVEQQLLATESLPVNTEAFTNVCNSDLDEYAEYYNYWDEEDRAYMEMIEPDEAYIDDFRNIVTSVDRMNSADTTILIIMREEIQSYFAGDKTLDEVIDTINNRAQLYLDERD